MTDRFYPMGLTQEMDNWKTTYEVANEMRSYQRSHYPPGCAVHLPGARERFGHSTPGPTSTLLAKPELALREEIDNPNPRSHLCVPRMQEHDDHKVFNELDVPEMSRSYRSPVARSTLSPMARSSTSFMSRSRSMPGGIERRTVTRLSEPVEAITQLEDDHFTYFVPKGMHRDGKERLSGATLSKLQKNQKITMPFTGEGTGFKSQNSNAEWWPRGGNDPGEPTSYRTHFQKPAFYRMSPIDRASGC